MNVIKQILAIVSNQKEFVGMIGNPIANRFGLHIFRILLSNGICRIRTLPFFFLERVARQSLAKDGIVIIENFLEDAEFRQIKAEVYQQLAALPPALDNTELGFGKKMAHEYGFDRYDGGTLNRFARVADDSATCRFLTKNPRLSRLTLALFGLRNRPTKYFTYELRHGDESTNPDIQKQVHKDTFFHTYKLWYFVDAVTDDQGPFAYSLGSQRSTFKSLSWEYQMSCLVSTMPSLNRGGSFRASNADLQHMNYPLPCAQRLPANTLVIADTKGFHCRGNGLTGTCRIGIYANFRPLAFLPFFH
ncbi:MAG: phytanoyl-CoA dioxygenase family protein [Methylovulum sp.]|nr:phytanoyl-CoA dioxygenase family protein [Methylovulum sp.]MCF7999679.1 phytanoyl-CoA dioxygenase family protein [Methylovulum sp.]